MGGDAPSGLVDKAIRRVVGDAVEDARAFSTTSKHALSVKGNEIARCVTMLCAQAISKLLHRRLAALERLGRLHPGFSRLYQERGHCHVAQRDAPRAIAAFLHGVNINPALPAAP